MTDTDDAPGWASRSVARAQAVKRALERARQGDAGHYVRASWPAHYGWPAGEQLLCADTEEAVRTVAADWRQTHRTPKPGVALAYIGHRGQDDINARPLLANARQAADDYLMRKVADGSMQPETAAGLAGLGFSATSRILSELRTSGLGEEQITAAYGRQLAEAKADNDGRRIVAAEFSLAIWGGMLADLADYLRGTGTEAQR